MGDGGFHAGHEGLKDTPLLAYALLHQGTLGDHGVHGVGQQLCVYTQEPRSLLDQLVVGQIRVSILGPSVLQGELYAGEQSSGGVGLESGDPLGDGVRGHKADAVDIVDELIGVLLDLRQCQIPIGLEHTVCLVHGDAVRGQGHKDIPHGSVLVEGGGDHFQLLAADAGNLQQPLRFLFHDL